MNEAAGFRLSESGAQYARESWAALTADAPAREADRVFAELRDLYSRRGRAYHNLTHIEALLRQAANFEDRLRDSRSVQYAIWFHDAIYRTRRHDNEACSADLAAERLPALGMSAERVAAVRAMILATKSHEEDGLSFDGRLFLDLDLSILGADPETYDRYRRAIRAEYRWVPMLLYRRERRRVLERFLARPRIYFTEEVFASRESPARRNLEAEIASLA